MYKRQLYVRAGILDEHEEADLAEHISRDPNLNDRQKQTLLEIYNSFRSERAEAPATSDASEGSAGGGYVEPVTEPVVEPEHAAESAPTTVLPASLRAVL